MKKYRVGIVGCGNIFPMHAVPVSVLENTELVAVCDNKPERARTAAEKYHCKAYTSYQEMIDSEHLDSIHICTPHYLHAPIAEYAAAHKVNILTEKPMAITLSDAKNMVQAAEENGVRLMVSFQNRFIPASMLLKNTIASGKLGRIRAARILITWNRSDAYYSQSDWKGTWEKEGGGVVIDQAIHTLDLMNWIMDSEVESMDVHMENRAHNAICVDDTAEGCIRYQNGATASFFVMNYYTTDAPVLLEFDCEKGTATLVGEKATITYADGRTETAERDPNESIDFGNVKHYWGIGHMRELRHFYSCLGHTEPMRNAGKDILKTQELICALYQMGRARNPKLRNRADEEEMKR